jgi:hypothetical protein
MEPQQGHAHDEQKSEIAPAAQGSQITWNHAIEELLCQEAEKCSGLSWLHNRAETMYSNRTNYMQLPIIILSAVSGFISGVIPGDMPGATAGIGGVSIVVSILGTINSYFAFAKRTEGHRIAAVQYAQICRAIRIEMNLPQEQRTPPKILLKMIKDDLKRLSETAPRVPDKILEEFRKEIMPKADNISHPEIIDGIENVKPFQPQEPEPATPFEPHTVVIDGGSPNAIVSSSSKGGADKPHIKVGLQV